MKWVLWVLNPFATFENPYIPSRRRRLSWKTRRWIARLVWLFLILGSTALFHVGVEVACQQLPDICVRGQGRPNMAFIWAWSISLAVAGWIMIDLVTWVMAPASRPWIRIRRRWASLPALLIALLGLPQSSFAWSAGTCDWTNTVACLENQMINVGIIINVALWNMFNRPLLIGARLVERLREILVETFFRDALNGILAGVWPIFWISVGFALLFYAGTYALRLIVRWDIVDLQQLGVTIFLAFIFFGMGGVLLNANENIRIMIGQGFQEMASDAVSNTTTNFATIVEDDGSMLPAKNIYASEVCGGDTKIKRSIDATMISDYTARFLRADAVDIHCPIADTNQYGFVSVPTHLGPGPGGSQDDTYPPSTTGAYDSSPSEEEAFLFYYLEPNIQYRVFNHESATAQDREALFSRSMDGMYIQIQAIPLGIMAILEQALYLIFALCSFGVWLAICLSLVFAPFMATNAMFTGQLVNLVNIAKTSWISSFWMGLLLGFFNIGAQRGASLIVFVTGLCGIILILGLLAQAGNLFMRTVVDGAGSVLGSAPRATAGAFKSLGGGVKTVAAGVAAGVIAKRMTGDSDYARGAAMGQSKTMRQIAQGAAMARALATGKSPTDSPTMMGLNSSRPGESPFDWYSIKRHSANKARLGRNGQERDGQAARPQRSETVGGGATTRPLATSTPPRSATGGGRGLDTQVSENGPQKPISDTSHPLHQQLASDGVEVRREWQQHFMERGYSVQDVDDAAFLVRVSKPWSAPTGRLREMEARRREQDFKGVQTYDPNRDRQMERYTPEQSTAKPAGNTEERQRGRPRSASSDEPARPDEPTRRVARREARGEQGYYARQAAAEQRANGAPGQPSAPAASEPSAPRQLKRVPPGRYAQRRRPAAASASAPAVANGQPANGQPANGQPANSQPARRQRPPAHRAGTQRPAVASSQPSPSAGTSARSAAPATAPARTRPARLPFARGFAARRQQGPGLSVVSTASGNSAPGQPAPAPASKPARPTVMRRTQGGVPRPEELERRVARRLTTKPTASSVAAPAAAPVAASGQRVQAPSAGGAARATNQQPGRLQKVAPSRARMVAAQRGNLGQARQPIASGQQRVVSTATEKAVLSSAAPAAQQAAPQRAAQSAVRPVAQRAAPAQRQRPERQPTTVITSSSTTTGVKSNTKSDPKSNPRNVVVLPATPEGETPQDRAMKRPLKRPRY